MSLLGNVMNPPLPYVGSIPGGNLSVGTQIIIQGTTPYHSDGFSMNLMYGPKLVNPRSDTALHFNPRFSQNCVVRNSYKNNWAAEERHNGMPFAKQAPFEIVILADLHCYKISVNNRHFCDFQHRMPMAGVNTFTVEGTVSIDSIRFIGPQPPPYSQPPVMSYPAAQPPVPVPIYNPAVPLTTGIPGGLHHGKMIFISGVPAGTNRFSIYLQDGALHNADVGMVFDVRFNFGSCVNIIVRNHRSRGQWGQEERAIPFFPFMRNSPFDMIILCENSGFKVAVNNQHFVEFKHRLMPLSKFNMLHIDGDVKISQVRFQ